MTYSLENKVAIVTGASRQAGIGAAIAKELARAGVVVFITYHQAYDETVTGLAQPNEAEALLAELQQLGVPAAGWDVDLSDPAMINPLLDRVTQTLGQPTILINNAAYSERDGWPSLTAELLDKHYAVNVRGMMVLSVEFVRRYQAAGATTGRIINLTSGQGLTPMPQELAYVATKGAVEAFTISFSAAVVDLGITVNAVDPGLTDSGWLTPALRAEFMAQAPQGRLGRPVDAARLVRFLASDEAGWITGQIIRSRGGM